MGNSTNRSRYESSLSTAHKALYWASERAAEIGDEGAAEDCEALLHEISRLMQDSLKDRKRPRRQLSAFDS